MNSDYKPVVDRVQELRRDVSHRADDDEDDDSLFAELEAELENADSAALRDRGIGEMQAQLRQFSFLRSLNRSIDRHLGLYVGWERSKPWNIADMGNTQKLRTRKRLSERARE